LPPSFLRGTAAAGGIGLFNTLGSLGGFLGPAFIGILREGSGDYATGMAAIAGGFVLAALIVLAVGRAMAPRPFARQVAVLSLGSRKPTPSATERLEDTGR